MLQKPSVAERLRDPSFRSLWLNGFQIVTQLTIAATHLAMPSTNLRGLIKANAKRPRRAKRERPSLALSREGVNEVSGMTLNYAAVYSIWSSQVWQFKTPDTFPDFRNVTHTFGRINQLSCADVR